MYIDNYLQKRLAKLRVAILTVSGGKGGIRTHVTR